VAKCTEVCRLRCRAYGKRLEQEDPAHQRHREARRAYGLMLKHAKKEHWQGFIASVDKSRFGWHITMCQVTPQMGEKPMYPPSRHINP